MKDLEKLYKFGISELFNTCFNICFVPFLGNLHREMDPPRLYHALLGPDHALSGSFSMLNGWGTWETGWRKAKCTSKCKVDFLKIGLKLVDRNFVPGLSPSRTRATRVNWRALYGSKEYEFMEDLRDYRDLSRFGQLSSFVKA